jgi:hypothetical protein
MGLIVFHRFLIGTAIVFFGFFGLKLIKAHLDDPATVRLLGGIGSLLVSAALVYYLARLRRFLGSKVVDGDRPEPPAAESH